MDGYGWDEHERCSLRRFSMGVRDRGYASMCLLILDFIGDDREPSFLDGGGGVCGGL